MLHLFRTIGEAVRSRGAAAASARDIGTVAWPQRARSRSLANAPKRDPSRMDSGKLESQFY